MNEDTYTGIYPEDKAKQSNLTVAVSFGLEREAAFEHAKTKVGKRVSIRFAIMQKAISINVISHTLLTLLLLISDSELSSRVLDSIVSRYFCVCVG